MSFMPIYGDQRPAGLLDGYSLMGLSAPSGPAFNPLSFILQSMFQPQIPSWNAGGYGGIGTGGMGGGQNMNMGANPTMSPLMSLLSLIQNFRPPANLPGFSILPGNPPNSMPGGSGQLGRNLPMARSVNNSGISPEAPGASQDKSQQFTRGRSVY